MYNLKNYNVFCDKNVEDKINDHFMNITKLLLDSKELFKYLHDKYHGNAVPGVSLENLLFEQTLYSNFFEIVTEHTIGDPKILFMGAMYMFFRDSCLNNDFLTNLKNEYITRGIEVTPVNMPQKKKSIDLHLLFKKNDFRIPNKYISFNDDDTDYFFFS